jgi:type I restriction enzyme, S subunit
MRSGWNKARIRDLGRVQSGSGFPTQHQGKRDDPIPFYKVSDMSLPGNDRYMLTENNTITEEIRKRLGASVFPRGSVIFPKIGGAIATNKKRITTRDCCVDNNVMGVIPKPGRIDSDLLFYFFVGHDLSEFANEAHLPSIKKTTVENWELCLPASLSEQRRIVDIIDDAFEGIATAKANGEKNLRNARTLFESHLQAVFTQRGKRWDRVTLEALLERGWIVGHLDGNHGGNYPRKEEFISKGVPYISANCVDEDRVDMARAKYLAPDRAALLRKGIAKNNDVLFAHNATVGPVAILETEEEKVILGTSLTYYRCDPGRILPEYLAHYMRSFGFKTQYLQVMRQSTRNQVPITKQREFYHVIPPMKEQEAIVAQLDGFLESGRSLASLCERKLTLLEELKKSLLHRAFSGQL